MRIAAFLAEERVSCEFLLHPPAFTAQKRAKYLHVTGGRVGKCVLLRGPLTPSPLPPGERGRGEGGWLLAVLPATRRVDFKALAEALGGPVRLATGRELAEVFGDCEWGAAPPFGRLYGLQTLLEDGISPDTVLVFETHTHMEAVRIRCSDFERLERPRRLRFARTVGG